MTGHTLQTQLTNYIRSVRDQGILGESFDQVKALQSENDPRFLADLICSFIPDAENCISQLSNFLTRPHVDFEQAAQIIHKLKGSSSSLGGQRMGAACRALRTACEDRQYSNCVRELARVTEEFDVLKDCLAEIAQMERRIYAYSQSNRNVA